MASIAGSSRKAVASVARSAVKEARSNITASPVASSSRHSRHASSSVSKRDRAGTSAAATTSDPNSSSISISAFHPLLDLPSNSVIPPNPRFNNPTHIHINHPTRLFPAVAEADFPEQLDQNTPAVKDAILSASTGLSTDELRGLYKNTVVLKRVVNMTKKGKMPSFFAMLVVGSPSRGLVGIGQGRGDTAPVAIDSGFHRAVLSMDRVNRFEGRTLWGAGAELSAKWGSTTVVLRGRPAGFGLAVPPALHRVLSACGIRDASGTVKGSRNDMQILKAALQVLHGGSALPGLGNGTNIRAPRRNKGMGMRDREEIERERGRYGIEVGRRI